MTSAYDRLKQQYDDLGAALEAFKPSQPPIPPPPNIIKVTADTLQATIDKGVPEGSVLVLPDGSNCGPIELRGRKVTLSSDTVRFPLQRVTPESASTYAKINATIDRPAIRAGAGAAFWTLHGIEAIGHPQSNNHTISFVEDSTDLLIDRCYVHGDPLQGAKVGIVLNSGKATVRDSCIVNFFRAGQDTQAIAAAQGTGPFEVTNCLLEAAGENMLVGGDDPTTPGRIPSDILVKGNLFRKPLDWKSQPWTVKNLFELKNAKRVTITDNDFENCWVQGQVGYAIVFTPRNQDGNAHWSTIEDVLFQNNRIRNVAGAFNLLGTDDIHPSGTMKRVQILDTTIDGLGAAGLGLNGKTFQINGVEDLTIQNVTVTGEDINSALAFYGKPCVNLIVTGNKLQEGQYGITGDSTGLGIPALNRFAPGFTWSGNTILKGANGRMIPYPAGTMVVNP